MTNVIIIKCGEEDRDQIAKTVVDWLKLLDYTVSDDSSAITWPKVIILKVERNTDDSE